MTKTKMLKDVLSGFLSGVLIVTITIGGLAGIWFLAEMLFYLFCGQAK